MIPNSGPAAPPIPDATAFYLRFFAQVGAIRDLQGRALHEVDFREEVRPDGIRACPFKGSRHGRKMNWEALQVIAADWRSIVTAMRVLRAHVCVERDGQSPGEVMWSRALVPMFLPLYMRCAAGGAVHGVDTTLAGLFKVMLDVPTTLDLMLAAEWATGAATAYTPEAVADFAERTEILNNGEWTCAGPPGLIREILSAAFGEVSTDLGSRPPCLDGVDLEEFTTFAALMTRQYAVSQAFQIATAFRMEQAFAQLPRDAVAEPARPASVSAYERRRRRFLAICGAPSSCQAVVRGFLHLAAPADGRSGRGTTEGYAAELNQVTQSPGMSPECLLSAQCRAEAALRSVVLDLQGEMKRCVDHFPLGSETVEFSALAAADFPSNLLQQKLNDDS